MQDIHALSQQYGFRIIEDASHAIGGRYQDASIGSCCATAISLCLVFIRSKLSLQQKEVLLAPRMNSLRIKWHCSEVMVLPATQIRCKVAHRALVLPADRAGLQLPDDRAAGSTGQQPNGAIG